MILYWLLLAFPASMALIYPLGNENKKITLSQNLPMQFFALAYIILATTRFEIGGDWAAYLEMYNVAKIISLTDTMTFTDPFFALLIWVSGQLDWGIYPANGICAALMVIGIIRIAQTTREPWLAITFAVPYLLIVVGMGYVRQAGAIGLILIAISSLDRGKWVSMIAQLFVAIMSHSTAGMVFPLFGQAMMQKRRILSFVLTIIGAAAFFYIINQRLDKFTTNYIDNEFDSGGAIVRAAMNFVPAALLLIRWKYFSITGRSRSIWLGFALASIGAIVALALISSSTVVDRLGLYFAPIQLIVTGSLTELIPLKGVGVYFLRALTIAIAVVVQLVWLLVSVYAVSWVPYHSILTQ